MEYNRGKFRHIFHKGEEKSSTIEGNEINAGMNYPNNAPGLYLTPVKNNLLVVMNTFHNITAQVEIEEVLMYCFDCKYCTCCSISYSNCSYLCLL